ncbi:MAG: hypothetical protein R2726_11705 [Acidimicrobiales bacterium]
MVECSAPEEAPTTEATRGSSTARLAIGAVVGWALVIAVARAWGVHLEATGTPLILFTPPVIGGYREALPAGLPLVAALGIGLALGLPLVATRLAWRPMLAALTAGAALWWLGLALVDGRAGLTRGLYYREDYADAVARVADGPGAYLRDYVATLPGEPIALRGHPPGLSMLFGLLHAAGLRGEGWAAAAVLLAALSTVAAVLVLLRCVAGEPVARRAGPFLALAPAATWIVTSTDALTMATGAWFLTLLALAGATPAARRRSSDVLAIAAGVLAAGAALQSYGMVLLAVPAAVLAWHQRRWRPLLLAALVAAGLVGLLAAWGFWWIDGLAATAREYHELPLERPYRYFVVGNLGAWALALGPATAAGLVCLRDRATWVVVGGGLAAALLADLSGLSEGEVERIWLPFTILVLPAAACLWTSRRAASGWLAAQVASAVAFTAVIGANW